MAPAHRCGHRRSFVASLHTSAEGGPKSREVCAKAIGRTHAGLIDSSFPGHQIRQRRDTSAESVCDSGRQLMRQMQYRRHARLLNRHGSVNVCCGDRERRFTPKSLTCVGVKHRSAQADEADADSEAWDSCAQMPELSASGLSKTRPACVETSIPTAKRRFE